MVQDLRKINSAVQTRAPNVTDPHTLLNSLQPNKKFFTVVDLSNAFFSVPVHPDSQFWFAFTYKEKPFITLKVDGKIVKFLCDTGACRTVLSSEIGLTPSKNSILVRSADGVMSRSPLSRPISVTDPVSGQGTTACVVLSPECPVNLLGRDLMSVLKISVIPVSDGMRAFRHTGDFVGLAQNHKPTSPGVYYSLDAKMSLNLKEGQELFKIITPILTHPHKEMQLDYLHVTMALRADLEPEYQQSFMPNTPLAEGAIWFVDGSCYRGDSGSNNTGYAVTENPDIIVEAKALPSFLSAQAAEIVALRNRLADEVAKQAAAGTFGFSDLFHSETDSNTPELINHNILADMQNNAPLTERRLWNSKGNMRPNRGQFPQPSYPFQTMHMDFIELTQSGPYKYCLVMIDAFSKWVEIVPTAKNDALTVAKAICKTIIATHGIPQTLYSDNGTHFVNDVIQHMAEHLGITLKNHCAYHPQSAGLVERTNGTIKSRLRKCMEETKRPWPECLDLVKLYMRIPPTDKGLTPFEIIYGRVYRLPICAPRSPRTCRTRIWQSPGGNLTRHPPLTASCSAEVSMGDTNLRCHVYLPTGGLPPTITRWAWFRLGNDIPLGSCSNHGDYADCDLCNGEMSAERKDEEHKVTLALTLYTSSTQLVCLARLQPSSYVFSESALLQTTSSSRILKRDFKPVQVFKPFSDNGGRKPLHGDGDGLLYTILPWVGTSRLTKDVNTIWWCLENITDILADITAQMADNPEIKALRAMAMQHQVALDLLLHLKVVCVKS
uniref:Integrase catalytic domain-containing protein n=2 Tax=Iconisemion striatum TaxID=60296 RepID=A0A1A7Z5N2_9TELE